MTSSIGFSSIESHRQSYQDFISSDVNSYQLFDEINERKLQTYILEIENNFLQKFLQKIFPKANEAVIKLIEREKLWIARKQIKKSSVDIRKKSILSAPRSSDARSTMSHRFTHTSVVSQLSVRMDQRINVSTKTNLLEIECGHFRKMIQDLEIKRENTTKNSSSKLEAIQLNSKEIEKTMAIFNDLVLMDPKGQFLVFTQNWMKSGGILLETMRLKTTIYLSRYRKTKNQLSVKEELSEILRPVDFDQLIIQKSMLTSLLEETTNHLYSLKKTTAKLSLSLVQQKQNLINIAEKLKKMEQQIVKADETYDKMQEDENIIRSDNKYSKQLQHLETLQKKFDAPGVIEYAVLKEKLFQLKTTEKQLQRKNHILRLELENKKKLRKIPGCNLKKLR